MDIIGIYFLIMLVVIVYFHFQISFDLINDYLTVTYVVRKHTIEGYYPVTYTKRLIKIK